MINRSKDGIEKQLTVFTAGIPVAYPRVERQDVVAIDLAAPRKDTVVDAEQADDAVRH